MTGSWCFKNILCLFKKSFDIKKFQTNLTFNNSPTKKRESNYPSSKYQFIKISPPHKTADQKKLNFHFSPNRQKA